MRSKTIQNYILYILLDCKKHTLSEIAEKTEISYSTAQRHLSELASIFPIEVIAGGRNSGGVQMRQSAELFENFFSKNEINLMVKGLLLLQKEGIDTTELIQKISATSEIPKHPHADTPAISSVRSNENGRVM